MGLTDIANRLTPSTPIELTFGAQPTASGKKFAVLFGHRAATGGTGTDYGVYTAVNVGDPDLAKAEIEGLAGAGAEIAEMAYAFVKANSSVSGRANFTAFRVVLIPSAQTGFGPADEAITAVKPYRADFLVNCYDATGATNRNKLRDLAALLAGPDRDLQGQFGTTAIMASIVAAGTQAAFNIDNQYVLVNSFPDTNVAPAQPVSTVAAASAGVLSAVQFPYLPLEALEIGGLLPPTNMSDRIDVSPTGLSETLLTAGLSPLYVDSAGRVRYLRARLTRVTTNGTNPATAYFDWQDIQTLYDFREDCFLRLQQPDLKPKKASIKTAKFVKDEILRIAAQYEDAEAFQAVADLAKLFVVQPSATSRGRFDFFIPVNVVPGLYVVAGNIQATTLFDQFTL